MRYKYIKEFVEELEQNKQADSQNQTKVKQPRQSLSKPQIILTPELKQAIYDCVPPQADERSERYIFNKILGQITDVEKFMKLNHSDIRHAITDQFIKSKTSQVGNQEIEQSLKTARDAYDTNQISRELENNHLKQVGTVVKDNIYQVTMSTLDSNGVSHISQQKLDAVSKNEGKRYDAKKFDYVIQSKYHTRQFVVVLIENLDEASVYLIILIDLTTGNIYCGRRYANLVNVISETGRLNSKAIRRKIVYNENSSAQVELYDVCLIKIAEFQEFITNRDTVGLFDLLNVEHNHGEIEHQKINKIGQQIRQQRREE